MKMLAFSEWSQDPFACPASKQASKHCWQWQIQPNLCISLLNLTGSCFVRLPRANDSTAEPLCLLTVKRICNCTSKHDAGLQGYCGQQDCSWRSGRRLAQGYQQPHRHSHSDRTHGRKEGEQQRDNLRPNSMQHHSCCTPPYKHAGCVLISSRPQMMSCCHTSSYMSAWGALLLMCSQKHEANSANGLHCLTST